mgnify:FL=1|jgi:hypothetical protein
MVQSGQECTEKSADNKFHGEYASKDIVVEENLCLTPMRPNEYALTLVRPMSSPKMTRMFGRWLRAIAGRRCACGVWIGALEPIAAAAAKVEPPAKSVRRFTRPSSLLFPPPLTEHCSRRR